MNIHFDEMQVNRDKGNYIPSDEELVELYDEYEHYEDTGRGQSEVDKWQKR